MWKLNEIGPTKSVLVESFSLHESGEKASLDHEIRLSVLNTAPFKYKISAHT